MSYINRLMMEDLPTAWSPRKTILYFNNGGMVPLLKFKLLMFVILFFKIVQFIYLYLFYNFEYHFINSIFTSKVLSFNLILGLLYLMIFVLNIKESLILFIAIIINILSFIRIILLQLMQKLGQIQLQKTVTVKVQCNLNDEIVVRNFQIIMDCLKDLNQSHNDLLSKYGKLSERLSTVQKSAAKDGEKISVSEGQQKQEQKSAVAQSLSMGQADKQNLLKMIKQLDGRTSKNESNILDNIKDINLINKQIAELKELLSKLKNNNNANSVTDTSKNNNDSSQLQSISNINKQMQSNKQLINKTNEQLEKLRKQLASLKQKLDKLAQIQDKNSKLMGDLKDKGKGADGTSGTSGASGTTADSNGLSKAELNQLRQKIAILNKKTNGLELMSDQLKNQTSALGQGQEALQNTTNNLKNQIQSLKQLLKNLGKSGGDNKNSNLSNLDNLKSNADDLRMIKNELKELRIDVQQLKRDHQSNSKTSIEDDRRNKAALTQARFKDDASSLKDIIARLQYLQKMIGGSKNSIDDKNADKLPLIKRPRAKQRDASFNEKSSSKKDIADIKAQIQAWLNNYLIQAKSKDNFEDIQLKIQQIKRALNNKADQEGLKKGLAFVENKINHLYLFLTEPDGDDAMIVRKGFNCLSCSKKVQKLRGKIGPHINWNNMTSTNYSPPKVGYSKHMPQGSGQRQQQN